MRRFLALAMVGLLLLVLVPGTQAAINRPKPLQAEYPYMPGLTAVGSMAIVSGSVDATLTPAPGSFGFFDTPGLSITGLDRVCYSRSQPCQDGPGGSLSIVIADGGSFALCLPSHPGGHLVAKHGLAMFVDFAAGDDLNSFLLDKSLVVPAIDGTLTFPALAAIPASALAGSGALSTPCSTSGGIAALDDTTQIQLRRGTTVLATVSGKTQPFLFTGVPSVPVVEADFFIAPFGSASTVGFTAAPTAAAREGLDIGRVQNLIQKVDSSSAGSQTERTQTGTSATVAREALADLLNGAVVGLPSGIGGGTSIPVADLQFARFTTLTVRGTSNGLDWSGKATLELGDGKVVGAQPLLGIGPVKFPWWTYALWLVAIGVFIARLNIKPDKTHPVWDRFKWIGWVATILVTILVLWLWDLEMKAVFGFSFLHGSTGQARLAIGVIEAVLLSLFGILAALPLRIALRNTFLLTGQGTFMGLAGSLATLVGFVLSALSLRSVLGLILEQVIRQLA